MRITRFSHDGRAGLGAVLDGDAPVVADLRSADPPLPDDVGGLLAGGHEFVQHLDRLVDKAPRLALNEVRLEAPIPHPPSFLAVGLNYREHAAETGRDVQERSSPVIFNKQTTCVTGPFDQIVIPRVAPDHVDYEGELGVVIGTRCRAVPVERAHEVVAGYLVVNDVSVRDWQYPATPGPWARAGTPTGRSDRGW